MAEENVASQYIVKFLSDAADHYNEAKQAVIVDLIANGFVKNEQEAQAYPRVTFNDQTHEIGFNYNWMELTMFFHQGSEPKSRSFYILPFDNERAPTASYLEELIDNRPMQVIRTAGSIEKAFERTRSELESFYTTLEVPALSPPQEVTEASLNHTVFNLAEAASRATHSGNPGALVIGEDHGGPAHYKFLIQNLDQLKQRGANAIVLEHFFVEQNAILQKFIDSKPRTPMPPELDCYVTVLDRMINETDTGENTFRGLLEKARELGLSVRGVETEAGLYTQNGLAGEVDGKSVKRNNQNGVFERMRFMNKTAYDVALPFSKDGKFPILVAGASHAAGFHEGWVKSGSQREVQGLASMFGTEAVAILNDSSTPIMSGYIFVTPLKQQINLLHKSFSDWQAPLMETMMMTISTDDTIRLQGMKTLAKLFEESGRHVMEQSINKMVKLCIAMAQEQGVDPLESIFAVNRLIESDVAGGLGVVTSQISGALEPYYAFKAVLDKQPLLNYANRGKLIGEWPPLSEGETRDIVVSAFKRIGYDKITAEILDYHTDTNKDNDIHSGIEKGKVKVYLNPNGSLLDPRMAGHEVGHAIHDVFSGNDKMAPALAETVAFFSEALIMKELNNRAETPKQKIALLSDQLNYDIEQLDFLGKFQFERKAFEYAVQHPDTDIPIMQLWREAMAPLSHGLDIEGESGRLMDAKLMQSSHSIYQPGYGLGYMLAWAAAPQLIDKIDDPGFQKKFSAMLACGNDITPKEFLAEFDIDITKPEFWEARIQKMQKDVDTLKQLYQEEALSQQLKVKQSKQKKFKHVLVGTLVGTVTAGASVFLGVRKTVWGSLAKTASTLCGGLVGGAISGIITYKSDRSDKSYFKEEVIDLGLNTNDASIKDLNIAQSSSEHFNKPKVWIEEIITNRTVLKPIINDSVPTKVKKYALIPTTSKVDAVIKSRKEPKTINLV